MAWNNPDQIVAELHRLNTLLSEHPCFFDGATIRRLSSVDSTVCVFSRASCDEKSHLLIFVNLDVEERASYFLPRKIYQELNEPDFDLLAEAQVPTQIRGNTVEFRLHPGQGLCLASTEFNRKAGAEYRLRRGQHAWAVAALASALEPEQIGPHSWLELAQFVANDPKRFLAALNRIKPELSTTDLLAALGAVQNDYPNIIEWNLIDTRRVTPVPPRHWLLLSDETPFRATLAWENQQQHCISVRMHQREYAVFAPLDAFRRPREGPATIQIERYGSGNKTLKGKLTFLDARPDYSSNLLLPIRDKGVSLTSPTILLTNGRGGMARMCVDLGAIKSKYDCVLGANLHPWLPVDRHVFVKRVRVWANADRFITPLTAGNLQSFDAGPPVRWEFAAIAGNGQFARIELKADMIDQQNTVLFSFCLLDSSKPSTEVNLTIRLDIEDRNFHSETQRSSGAEHHFSANCHTLRDRPGFDFRPPGDRRVSAYATSGQYHPVGEWSTGIPHPVEQSRGQPGSGDAYSPGWFEIPLTRGVPVYLVVNAELENPQAAEIIDFPARRHATNEATYMQSELADPFGRQLALAVRSYVVRRDEGRSIIAGYPWFLDWGRDSLICARGLLSAGMLDEVGDLLMTFGRFEHEGTLPNTIHGADASNRDTTDAPLWYGIVAEELAALRGSSVYECKVDSTGRTIADVLRSVAVGYLKTTPNRIHIDNSSGLIWSPSHFTWMDTNYPAGSPREGYPIEIQALWIRLLEQLDRLGMPAHQEPWRDRAERARESLLTYFWLEEKGWFADVLLGAYHVAAHESTPDDALRSNCVIPISLDLIPRANARRCLLNALRYLVVPGALRSLAPLPVQVPLPIHGSDWRLLNNPHEPYWGRYEGDEDTQRKPAYHNGTAWTWTFPGLCEGIARAWQFSPGAVESARAYLGSMEKLLEEGCIGHIPEVLDGDAPHTPRGCDAQAWGVTEALRVWKLLAQPDLPG